jgi:hypothetical protein
VGVDDRLGFPKYGEDGHIGGGSDGNPYGKGIPYGGMKGKGQEFFPLFRDDLVSDPLGMGLGQEQSASMILRALGGVSRVACPAAYYNK